MHWAHSRGGQMTLKTGSLMVDTGGSWLSHTAVKPDSCITWIFAKIFLNNLYTLMY